MIRLGVVGAAAVAAFFVFITVVFGIWYTIDQTERGVILRNGAIVGTAEPGLSFKMPWIDSVRSISVQSHKQEYDKMAAYSADQQPAEMRVSVNFHIPPSEVASVYASYGSFENLISRVVDPRVYEETKTVFGQFNAVTAIQERARLNAEIGAAIQKAVKGPVVIENVQIENIDFSDAYEQSIEQRMLAEVEVQRVRQNLEKEKV